MSGKLKHHQLVAILILLPLFSPANALAQQAPDGEKPNCTGPQTGQSGKQENGASNQNAPGGTALPPCDGVLVPPATGDKAIEKPVPDTGNTPIVRPGDVPQQEPNME